MAISQEQLSRSFLSVVKAENEIGGYCPSCHELFRLNDVGLFFIPDRREDFLDAIRKKERELEQNLDSQLVLAREDAIKRSRSALMGKLFETVRPYLPGFSYNPNDLRAIWQPVDFVCFNGLALRRQVDSITFIEIKTGRSQLTPVERSIRRVIEDKKISFETVTSPDIGPQATGSTAKI